MDFLLKVDIIKKKNDISKKSLNELSNLKNVNSNRFNENKLFSN